jgi:hypothetical protein
MRQSVSLVTLGVADYARAKAWEIAHNPGFGLDGDGNVVLPRG